MAEVAGAVKEGGTDERARAVLRVNDRGGYTVPTDGLYPFQWNWDSAFAAWGFSTFDIDRAWRELETLFSAQRDDGMVPHIVFHEENSGYFPGPEIWGAGGAPPTSGFSQPPVAAILARRVWEADPEAGRGPMKALLPKLLAWHRWWSEYRCRSGVATVAHPWESGRDNCPDWDIGMAGVDVSNLPSYCRRDTDHVEAAMRPRTEDYDRYLAIVRFGRECGWDQNEIVSRGPFLMADPAVTFILIRANEDLAWLEWQLGGDGTRPAKLAAELRAGAPSLLNPETGVHEARDIRSGAFAGSPGSGAFLAWLAGEATPDITERLVEIWNRARIGLPSADPASSGFEPRRYWRGPVWAVVNALAAIGLSDSGLPNLAERLRSETAEAIRRGGFAEYFDPLDGTPCGGGNFTWTAAVWLAWVGRGDRRGGRPWA